MATFKIHARVLDLLGEEQIADCPTAISELFKNAYDAYASKVSLDVYVEDGCALLWDDGIGMSEEDVLTRWLVVGTPGKKMGAAISTPPPEMVPRPIMGEKGIGRLAISTLGDTLLLLSKQSTNEKASSYTALLINWNVVRNDRLLLSDIEVPVIAFDDLKDLESGILRNMVDNFLAPIKSPESAHLWNGSYALVKEKIIKQLSNFDLDLSMLTRTGIDKRANGTVFYIADLVSDLPLYVASPNREDSEKDTPQALLVQLLGSFQKQLLTNEFGGDMASSQIEFHADVRKRDKDIDKFRSVFEDWKTFNDDDLSIADHHFKINFDEFGRYSGAVRRYDEIIELPPDEKPAKLGVDCGPFSLEFWYWQGEADKTKLTSEQKKLIDDKLPLFGGLLLYRDNLRVLPYGRPEFDWLKIEERRSAHAGRNFFSYRRMFGSVSISRNDNPALRDKAGREGLKSNKEYRDFRKVLINFLTSIAKKHFGESEEFKAKKAEVEAHQALLKKERDKVKNKRDKLAVDLHERMKVINDGEDQLKKLLSAALEALNKHSESNSDEGIIKTNIDFENRVSKLEENARFIIPSNLSIGRSGNLRKLKHDYEEAWPRFKAICMTARSSFSAAVKREKPDVEMAALRKRAIENALFQGRSKIGKAHSDARGSFDDVVEEIETILDELKRGHLNQLESTLLSSTFAGNIEQALVSQFGELSLILGTMEQVASDAEAEARSLEARLVSYFKEFSQNQGDVISAIQTDEIEDLKQQIEQNLELVQLGLSVEIIDHDLQKLYRGIKMSLSKLQRLWKDAPKSLGYLSNLTANFQHLEQRYQLMSPLYRNSYRAKSEFDGNRVFQYLQSFLSHELETHGVVLEANDAFLNLRLNEVPARVLPVFINVIDNAIFWLRESDEKIIRIGRVDNVVTINDTGPGIHPTMLREIFKPFVSEKPSGRGLGLYIARANLELAGHEIWAETNLPYKTMGGACFCIRFNSNAIKN